MQGLFIRERMFRVGKHLPIVVVAPQPWFPGQQLIRWFRPHFRPMASKREVMDGVVVHRPRFFCIPGVLKWTDGLFMALSFFFRRAANRTRSSRQYHRRSLRLSDRLCGGLARTLAEAARDAHVARQGGASSTHHRCRCAQAGNYRCRSADYGVDRVARRLPSNTEQIRRACR